MYHIYMKLIVGLGNPGEKYKNNRHNIGFVVAERVGELLNIDRWIMNKRFMGEVAESDKLILIKPNTFMNESGKAVSAISRFYKIKSEDTYIIHDDLDIQLGNFKIQHGKAPKVHNGLLSVERALGTNKYWNVRVGVENREVYGNKGVPGVVYTLQDFEPEERQIVGKVVEEVVVDLLTRLE
ncbi:MAG: aminoacyl-tRNA hydrolase [Candidatus Microgenomates bacterium]